MGKGYGGVEGREKTRVLGAESGGGDEFVSKRGEEGGCSWAREIEWRHFVLD